MLKNVIYMLDRLILAISGGAVYLFGEGLSRRDKSVLRWLSFPDHPIMPSDRQVENFKEIEYAIKTGKIIAFNYMNGSKEKSHREVLPKILFRRKEAIYCRAFDVFHKEYRVFKLDRISKLRVDENGKFY